MRDTTTFRDETGASAVIVALMLVVLVMLSALVVDVGYWYDVKRQLQSAADAGALAGCYTLIKTDDHAAADSEARAYAIENDYRPADGMVVQSVEVTDEYVRVTTAKDAPPWLAWVFGNGAEHITAVAKAQRWPLAGARRLVPWALPIIDEVDRVEVALVTPAGAVVHTQNLAAVGDRDYSGVVPVPGPGRYDVRIRVYNMFGVYETFRDSQNHSDAFAARITSLASSPTVTDISVTPECVTAESPEYPVVIEVKTSTPQTAMGVEVGGRKHQMANANGLGTLWRYSITAASGDLVPSDALCTPVPLDIYVGNAADRTIDAYVIMRRSSHVIEDFDVSPLVSAAGGSMTVAVRLQEYAAHANDGRIYTLRVDPQAGEVGNYCELNFKSIQHQPTCPPDPADAIYGNSYYDWVLEGWAGGVHVGDIIPTSPGNSGANTARALDRRFAGLPPEEWVVDVPVVEKVQDKGGQYDVAVVNFASFLVHSYTSKGEVRGEFLEYVGLQGGWSPGGGHPRYWVDAPRLVEP